MNAEKLKKLLQDVQSGQISTDQAMERLKALPFEDLGHTRLDIHRELRQGMPEVVYCQNKTAEQVITILKRLQQHHDRVLATRVSDELASKIIKKLPGAKFYPDSRLLTLVRKNIAKPAQDAPYGFIVSAGTSDLPVAEEAAQTLEFLGSKVERAYDVGVAGIHRLFDESDRLFKADVIISIAGMEGALTSVIAGLVGCPVIGVPTSVGYGASFNGLAPLLTMLNSCATGVAVVNIDNGFGAAVYAHLILRRIQRGEKK